MKCPLCGLEFSEKNGISACSKCSLFKKCQLIRCPNCGFEMALEPKWLTKLRNKKRRRP